MWLDTLSELKKKSKKTLKQISDESGVPLGTLNKLFAGQTKDPKLDTVRSVVHALGYTLDDLDGKREEIKKALPYSDEAMKLAADYDDLDGHGKRVVRVVADEEKARCKEERAAKEAKAKILHTQKAEMETAEEIDPSISLPQPYSQVAAAEGSGAFLLDDGFEMVTVEMNQFTKRADVILKVIGRSMEPEVLDGDRILVREQPSVNVGEIGVFIIDGEGFLKEYAKDRLISLNPDVEDVFIRDFQSVECYGKFISVLNPEWVK